MTPVLLALVLSTTALGPGGMVAAHADDDFWESEYARNQEDLSGAKAALGALGNDIQAATADLQLIDSQLSGMYAELAASEADLDQANLELQIAEARTAVADNEVAAADARLAAAQLEREASEERFEDRVVALWKYGTRGYAQAILEADSISDALMQAKYVDRVLDNDKEMIDEIVAAEAVIATERAAVDRARDTLRLQESAVANAVATVEQIAKVQQILVDKVEVEQSRRKGILDRLRSDERRYQQTIAALEAESNRIKEELLRSRYAAGRPGKGEFVWPTSGAPGSGYGYRTHPISGERKLHTGIDIGAPVGQVIVSATDGLVVAAEWRGGYGLAVVIDHGGGVATLYAHQSRLAVSEGEIVASGQTIGYVGSTGYSTGPHLHFEVRVDGTPVDPMDWY